MNYLNKLQHEVAMIKAPYRERNITTKRNLEIPTTKDILVRKTVITSQRSTVSTREDITSSRTDRIQDYVEFMFASLDSQIKIKKLRLNGGKRPLHKN